MGVRLLLVQRAAVRARNSGAFFTLSTTSAILMELPKCRMKMPTGEILEGSICAKIITASGEVVLFWHSRDIWGYYSASRVIPEQLELF